MRRTSLLVGLLSLVCVAVATSETASAIGYLTPSASKVRVGDIVTVTTDVCAGPGESVATVTMQTQPARAKGLAPFVPLDLAAIGLTQTADGVSFHVTAAQAYTELDFRLSCNDAVEAVGAFKVKVFPPSPAFWWYYNNYGPYFTATPGYLFFLGASIIECAPGSPATGTLTAPGEAEPFISMQGTLDENGDVVFDMDLPADMPVGAYTGTIACGGGTDGVLAAAVSDSQPVYVGVLPDGGTMPPTGGGGAVVPAALAAVMLGLGLVAVARRPQLRRSH